jgi:hypothetical protein
VLQVKYSLLLQAKSFIAAGEIFFIAAASRIGCCRQNIRDTAGAIPSYFLLHCRAVSKIFFTAAGKTYLLLLQRPAGGKHIY